MNKIVSNLKHVLASRFERNQRIARLQISGCKYLAVNLVSFFFFFGTSLRNIFFILEGWFWIIIEVYLTKEIAKTIHIVHLFFFQWLHFLTNILQIRLFTNIFFQPVMPVGNLNKNEIASFLPFFEIIKYVLFNGSHNRSNITFPKTVQQSE